jgi:hypothetical protein
MITQKNIKRLLIVVTVASSVMFMINFDAAYAHMSFDIVPGSGVFKGSGGSISSGTGTAPTNGNHTVRIVIGETDEPAYTGGIHDLEIRMTHMQTSFGVNNAHRDQTKTAYQQSDFSPTGKVLKVDTYFYPASTLYSYTDGGKALYGGVKYDNSGTNPGANTAGFWCNSSGTVSSNVLTGNANNCVPNAGGSFGYTDSRTGMFGRPLSAHEVPAGFNLDGTYRQSTRQHYTQQGLTLYHVYGSINYYNDTSIGLTNINLWTDGKNIKTLSLSQGTNYTNNVKQTYTGSVANRTATISGGFGLGNFTSSPTTNGYSQGIAWPDNSAGTNEQTYPTDIRTAIGQIRDNTWDIWNVLEDIANAINTLNPVPGNPIADQTPRNYTNPGPTSNGQYTFP